MASPGSASAGTVTVDFVAETAKFNAELGKVGKSLKGVETGFTSLAKAATAAIGVFSIGALTSFIKTASQAADELGKGADKIGVSTKALKTFQIAAGEAGVSLETTNKLLVESQARLGEAAAGTGEAAKFIKLLGLNVKDLQKLSPDELFNKYSEAINGLSNRSEQLAAANALMGKSAKEAFALIQAGTPAIADAAAFVERFGLALDRVEIKQIEQANDAIARVGTVSQAAGQRIAAGLAPALEFFANTILDATGNTKDLQAAAEQFGAAAIVAFEIVANAARSLQAAFFGIAAGGARVLQFLTFGDVSESFAASVDANLAKADEALSKIKSIEDIQATVIKALEDSRAKAEAAVADQAARDAAAKAGGLTLSDDISLTIAQQVDTATDIAQGAAEAQKEIARDLSKALIEEIDKRNTAEEQAAQFRHDLAVRTEQAILAVKQTTQNAALGLLQALGAKNKAFAIAAIVVEKALAIQRLLIQNQVAAELAFSSQLIPGIPATLATAAAAKAAVLTQGRIAAGLIAATGVLQIADVTSGGRAPIGSALNPAFVNNQASADQPQGATSQNAIQVIIANNIGFDQRVTDQLIAAVRDAADNRDVIIFGPNSRQAQELVTNG